MNCHSALQHGFDQFLHMQSLCDRGQLMRLACKRLVQFIKLGLQAYRPWVFRCWVHHLERAAVRLGQQVELSNTVRVIAPLDGHFQTIRLRPSNRCKDRYGHPVGILQTGRDMALAQGRICRKGWL